MQQDDRLYSAGYVALNSQTPTSWLSDMGGNAQMCFTIWHPQPWWTETALGWFRSGAIL